MNRYIPEKLRNFKPYKVSNERFKLVLDANESPFDLSDDIKRCFCDALMNTPMNRYPDASASSLRDAFAHLYGISADHVTAGNGSDELISVIVSAFCGKDVGLAVAVPDFSMYSFYGSLCEARIECFVKDADMTLDLDKYAEFVKEKKCSVVMFSNPCNPTGAGISADKVRDFVKKCDALVVLDEAYMDFWDQSLIKECHEYDNLIILRTLSKFYGSAGIRLGFAVACDELTECLRNVKSPYNVNSMTQLFGELVLAEFDYRRSEVNVLTANTKSLYNSLCSIFKSGSDKVYPTDTNFVLVRTDSAKRIYEMLKNDGISIRYFPSLLPGDNVIDGGYLRICTGTESDNKLLVSELKNCF